MSDVLSATPQTTQDDLFDKAEAALPGAGLGGYALPEEVRFIVREGHGGRLTSVEGREYIDFVCGAGATIIGHDHPAVIEAVKARADKGLHFFWRAQRCSHRAGRGSGRSDSLCRADHLYDHGL